VNPVKIHVHDVLHSDRSTFKCLKLRDIFIYKHHSKIIYIICIFYTHTHTHTHTHTLVRLTHTKINHVINLILIILFFKI